MNMDRQRRLAELLSFPCDYMFKAFGPNEPAFAEAVRSAVGSVLPVPLDALRLRPSAENSYLCVSVIVRLQNMAQLQAIYAALEGVKDLKYLL